MKSKRWLAMGLAIALFVTVGLALSGAPAVNAQGGGPFGPFKTIDKDALLAEELGVTVPALQAARERAHARAMEQALDEGLITEEQAERMQVRRALQAYLDPRVLTATALGIEEAELAEKRLPEWLDELGLDRATFQTQMQAAHEAAVAQAVADGVITQEQADALPQGQGMMGRMRGNMGGPGAPGMMRNQGNRGGNCNP